MQTNDLLDLHMTRLMGWGVHLIGKTLLVGVAAAALFAVLAVLYDSVGYLVAALIVGPVAAGLFLVSADPPLPVEIDDES